MSLSAARNLLASFSLVLGALGLIPPLAPAAEKTSLLAAMESITGAEVRKHVDTLADDTFEGRESGSRGGRAAGMYLVDHFRKLGVPGGAAKGGYFQTFYGEQRNILAFWEGGDPQLKDQVIVVSAHYDHVGYGNQRNSYGPWGYIHNGADDNASGVAGILELAEALTQLPERPARSILLALWDGEEKGLLGSKHWLDNPTIPLQHVRLLINMDMIGRLRNGRVEVYGTRTSYGLRRLVSQQNDPLNLQLDFTWELKENSDHYPFYARGIPILMLHTGLHGDYHRPSDDADKVNVDGVRQVAQLLLGLVVDAANQPVAPPFRNASRSESPANRPTIEYTAPALPGRLGVRWDDKSEAAGAKLSYVEPGTPAAKAGLRVGDRIVQFDGRAIDRQDIFRSVVLAASPKTTAIVERGGAKEPLTLPLALVGQPVRLGVTWRTSDAEPQTVILTRVIAGSPAELAGLKVHDRIHLIGGQEFADGEAFRQLTASTPAPIQLLIERRGHLRTVAVELPLEAKPVELATP